MRKWFVPLTVLGVGGLGAFLLTDKGRETLRRWRARFDEAPERWLEWNENAQLELERIQAEHLAHHARLRESGQVVTNGPVRDQPDVSLRGLTFYRTGSLAQARQLAEADPAVRAGRLAIEIMTWYCPPGTMSKPGLAVTL